MPTGTITCIAETDQIDKLNQNSCFFCDSHIHLAECVSPDDKNRQFNEWLCRNGYAAASCAHTREEYYLQTQTDLQGKILSFFGLHPQNPLLENAQFMEELLKTDQIQGIGETGFDFFSQEYKDMQREQEEAWHICLELAIQYGVPLVIHNRKALDLMFRDSTLLSKVPSVVFHCFAFGEREALSILNHRINAYFSFGKQLLNGNKKSILCTQSLPSDRILLETDAPYQTLKGETFTSPCDIEKVYVKACEIKGISLEKMCASIKKNFCAAYRCDL